MKEFIILSLAVWRFALLLVDERGPFDIFLKLRELFGIQHDDDGDPFSWEDNTITGILTCVWCASMWIGFFITIAHFYFPEITLLLSYPFALSAGAILANSVANK